MSTIERVVQTMPILNTYLHRQIKGISQTLFERGAFVPEDQIPEMVLSADASTLRLAFTGIKEPISYLIEQGDTPQIHLHVQQLSEVADFYSQEKGQNEPSFIDIVTVLNAIAFTIRQDVAALPPGENDIENTLDTTLMMMFIAGEIQLKR